MRSLLCALSLLLLTAAAPDSATYNDDASDLIYFLMVSDPHVESMPDSGKQGTAYLDWATGELSQTVLPLFMVNGGDLVDASGGGMVPLTQFDWEWESYQTIVDNNGMSPDFYFDLPGNHDQYTDGQLAHYLDFSVQGRAAGQTNHAWTHETESTKHLFVAVASCGSDGLPWPEDTVGLDQTDLDFLTETLAQHSDADIVTFFGHHPAAYFLVAKDELYDALAEADATAYLHGHTHKYNVSWQQGTFHFSVASLGKSGSKQVGLFAYDGRGLSARVFDVKQWPIVMITAPLDGKLGGSHKHDYMVSGDRTEAPVRALAFHPDGVSTVTGLIDGVIPVEMFPGEGQLWEGFFDATQLDGTPHTLAVTAATGDDSDEHAIAFYLLQNPVTAEPEPFVEQAEAQDVVSDAVPVEETVAPPQDSADDSSGAGPEPANNSEFGAGETVGAEAGPHTPAGAVGYIPAARANGCTASNRTAWSALLLLLLPLLATGLLRRRKTPLY